MARIWREKARKGHIDHMTMSSYDQAQRLDIQPAKDPLQDKWVYFVDVCGFTFSFAHLGQAQEARDYFSQKTHKSQRLPGRGPNKPIDTSDPQPSKFHSRFDESVYSEAGKDYYISDPDRFGDRMLRWYERLPKGLNAGKNRPRIVAAIDQLIDTYKDGQGVERQQAEQRITREKEDDVRLARAESTRIADLKAKMKQWRD